MKIKLLAIILSSHFSYAQVGVNTDIPTSTLTINGSYAGAFRTVTGNTLLDINDQFINVDTNTSITITLPNTINQPDITGRVYTVKNTSSQNISIRGFNNSQRLRTRNGSLLTVLVVAPGTTVQIIKNDNNNLTTSSFWEVILQNNITINQGNTNRTLTFARSISSPINGNTPNNSIVTIGNLRVRYNGTNPTAQGFIEFSLISPSHVTIWYQKAGNGGVGLDTWSTRVGSAGPWYRLRIPEGGLSENVYNINPENRDVSETIIVLHNMREAYRITSNLNGAIAASGGVPAVASSATLFVERLD